jgi:hypothetical protein
MPPEMDNVTSIIRTISFLISDLIRHSRLAKFVTANSKKSRPSSRVSTLVELPVKAVSILALMFTSKVVNPGAQPTRAKPL